MSDGRIAVLGAKTGGEGTGPLIDLYYGRYDSEEQVMNQVFLFLGDGKEKTNPRGEISESRWLFARDGFDYYLRTPQEALEMEKASDGKSAVNLYHISYGRMELARSDGNRDECIDSLVFAEEDHQKIVLTEERVIYRGFEDATMQSFKRPCAISICPDGSGRQASKSRYGVTNSLCYHEGYLYYEGWTNDGAFPRPLMRMRPDFTEEEKIGDLPGSLITVRDEGVCLWMDWKQRCIMAESLENTVNAQSAWKYLEDGEQGRREQCAMEDTGDGWLRLTLTPVEEPSNRETFWLLIPLQSLITK